MTRLSITIGEGELRLAVHRGLLRRFHKDPQSLVIDELGIQHGTSRVDIAVINGILHGFEIKSPIDSLDRLPKQVSSFCAVLDKMTLIAAEDHLERAMPLLPRWWGIIGVRIGPRGGITFCRVRRGKENRSVEPLALAQLLWRTEAQSILRALGADKKILRLPRREMYSHLATTLELDVLKRVVRGALKGRRNWRDLSPAL